MGFIYKTSESKYLIFTTKNVNCILYIFSLFIEGKLDKKYISYDYEDEELQFTVFNPYNFKFNKEVLYFLILGDYTTSTSTNTNTDTNTDTDICIGPGALIIENFYRWEGAIPTWHLQILLSGDFDEKYFKMYRLPYHKFNFIEYNYMQNKDRYCYVIEEEPGIISNSRL